MIVHVLGVPYRVVIGHVIGNDAGCVDHTKQLITLDHDLEYDHRVEALLHEVLHAIEFAMEINVEERTISCLSRGLFAVLTDPSNDAFFCSIAGSDQIMEDDIDVDDVADEVLEGSDSYYFDCDSVFLGGSSSASEEQVDTTCGASFGTACCGDAELRYPKAEDPDTEYCYQRFAEHCRKASEEAGSSTVTTTQDDLQGQDQRNTSHRNGRVYRGDGRSR